jgi:hypothetical protein
LLIEAMSGAEGNKRQRVTSNPCISVGDLMVPLARLQLKYKDRSICDVIFPKKEHSVTWKTAPCTAWLSSLECMFRAYLEIAPNAMIPPKKHKLAIEKIVAEGLVGMPEGTAFNTTRLSTFDFVDKVDQYVRIGLAQLRLLKSDPAAMQRAWNKCSLHEQSLINGLLDKLELSETPEEADGSAIKVPPVPTSWQSENSRAKAVPTASAALPLADLQPEPASSVFQRILAKHVSESVSPVRLSERQVSGLSATQKPAQKASFLDAPVLLSDLDESDEKLLSDARRAEPLAREGKSLLQRQRASKASSKAKKQEAKKGNTKKQKLPRKKPATLQIESSNCKANKPAITKQNIQAPSASHQSSQGPSSQPSHVADETLPSTKVLRKRALSKAYHNAYNDVYWKGYNDNPNASVEELTQLKANAKRLAQQAYKEAAERFDMQKETEAEDVD